jgi:CRP-like cAMP-binding protein
MNIMGKTKTPGFNIGLVSRVMNKIGRSHEAYEIQSSLSVLCESPALIELLKPQNETRSGAINKRKNFFEAQKQGLRMSRNSLELIVESLKEHYLFADMKWQHLAEIAMQMRPMRFMIGETVYKEGDRGNGGLFVVEDGHLEITIENSHSSFVFPGMCFGENALLYDRCIRGASIRVVPNSIVKKHIARTASVGAIRKSNSLNMDMMEEADVGRIGGCMLWMLDRRTYVKLARKHYLFSDSMLQRAIYAQILARQKEKMHGVIARTLRFEKSKDMLLICHHIFCSDMSLSNKISNIVSASVQRPSLHVDNLVSYSQLLSLAFGRNLSSPHVLYHFVQVGKVVLSHAGSVVGSEMISEDKALRADRILIQSLNAKYVMLKPSSIFVKYVEDRADMIRRVKSDEEDESSVDSSSRYYNRDENANMRAAKYKISEWFLNISMILKEQERFVYSFQAAQLALMYAGADILEIETETRIGCSPFNLWNKFMSSGDTFKMSSKTPIQRLRLAQRAYEICGLALHSLSIQTSQEYNMLHQCGNESLRRAKLCTVWLWHQNPTSENAATSPRGDDHESKIDSPKELTSSENQITDRISKLYRAKAPLRDVAEDLTFEKITNWTQFDIFEVAAATDEGVLFPTLFEVLFDTNGFNVIRTLNVSRSVRIYLCE